MIEARLFTTALVAAIALLMAYARFVWKVTSNGEPLHDQRVEAPTGESPQLSVIVPCRNEASRIADIIQDLQGQSIPVKVIVVDDHSDDDTAAVADSRGVQVLDSIGRGKKNALVTGYRAVRTPWVATVDADVRLGTDWARSILHCAIASNASAVVGPVVLRGNHSNGWNRFQALEFGSMLLWVREGIQKGTLAMGSGANLLFRTEHYPAERLHPEQPSGDDAFALQALRRQHLPIVWCNAAAAVAHTEPAPTWLQLWNQRGRWASKTAHQDTNTRRTAQLIAGLHIVGTMLAIGTAASLSLQWGLLTLFFWMGKSCLDMRMIHAASRVFRLPIRPFDYTRFTPCYAQLVGGAWWQLLFHRVQWKGRQI